MSNIIPIPNLVEKLNLSEGEVNAPRLSSLLTGLFIDNEIDEDGDIYITDGTDFPLWIRLVERAKLLCFFTHVPAEDAYESWVEKVNNLNSSIMVPQFSFSGTSVYGSYWMTYEGGLSTRQFIKMLRRFSGAFLEGVATGGGEPSGPSRVLH